MRIPFHLILLLLANSFSAVAKPNIILIMADDLGYGDLGCFGSTRNATPNLDALASDGVRLTQFYANAPVCTPTRAALLTGQYQQRSGFFEGVLDTGSDDKDGMPLEKLTIAEAFKALGYTTAMCGKWHLGVNPAYNPTHQGFDEFTGFLTGNIDYVSKIDPKGRYDWVHGTEQLREEGYITYLMTDDAKEFITANKSKPFFLYLAYATPHYPWQGPDDPAVRTEGSPGEAGPASQERYAAMIAAMDRGIGEIRALLTTLGIAENTILIFCSDNGSTSPGLNTPLRGAKKSLWEGGIRVPGMVVWPNNIVAGSDSNQVMLTMDLFPTLFGLGGLTLPAGLGLDGADLSSHLLGGPEIPRGPLFWGWGTQACVRDGDWKLTRNVSGTTGTQLYNLTLDVKESSNKAALEPDRVSSMTALLEAWEADVAASAPPTTRPIANPDDYTND